MKMLRWSLAVALCVAMSMVQAAGAAEKFQLGVGIHVGQNRNALEATDSALAQAGFTSFRDEVFWHRLETKPGVLAYPDSLRDLDQLVTRATKRKVRPLLILNYGNRFYDGGGLLSSADGIAAYSRYVRFVVKHFKGRVDQFEVWNEWNIGGGGTPAQRSARYGNPEDYARVLRAAYAAVKAENPAARVIGGAFAGYDYAWVEAFARAGGFSSLDGFSTHPYVFAAGRAGTPEMAMKRLDEQKALVDRLAPGRNLSLYVTEIGWPIHQGAHGVSEETSAEYLRRFMLLAKARPWIAGVWWYDLFDDGDDASNKEHRFGLISRKGVKRPAFNVLRREGLVAPEPPVLVAP
jgi:polysaccharide biosynthesis protein PslG